MEHVVSEILTQGSARIEKSSIDRYRWACTACGAAGPWQPGTDGLFAADDGMDKHVWSCKGST